ncbi:MAG: preprotein translocase subunit SecA [Clostridia bacterium]|nr:preprotein translocase subunit SecA [Clostridia bacterium]
MSLITKLFGTTSQREIKKIMPLVDRTLALEEEYAALSDSELSAKTAEFKARLAEGAELESLLPEAFATVREASYRILGFRAFKVQLVCAVILHQGRIAEMKTGEGKTSTALYPAYLNALTGKSVHVVTVNEYLAKFQGEQMGLVHKFLGLSVGVILHDMSSEDRKKAYECDITYGTNNEFGFDYLRDNMVIYKKQMVQRGHHFAIVDEVDSILIDEARTPLIISGAGEESTQLYAVADAFASRLRCMKVRELDSKEEQDNFDADYIVDEKAKTVSLTAAGVAKAEKAFHLENLNDPENATISHHINQAIRAHGIMTRDIDYVVRDGEVIIVDEFTGRLMFGRRYSDGLHQAIEAKEHVKVERENKTLATITFQNYFRMYEKLSGMTGTAKTEEEEFRHIYSLDVIEIPTNLPMIRADHADSVYKTEAGKFRAVIEQIIACHEKGQPVLVGTVSIEKSELLSHLLKKRGIKHEVLNAKQHEKEAQIVAQAGKKGAVTIATNMAGRGTDILLGGNAEYLAKSELSKYYAHNPLPEEVDVQNLLYECTSLTHTDDEYVLEARRLYGEFFRKFKEQTTAEGKDVIAAGGLFIIGTERHESRRIDNQLRGRSGRQGDPGESKFFLSLEDDLMRLFGSERIMGMMNSLGVDEDTPIDSKMLTNAIESAQKRLESRNFQTRKHVLEYDDVMNLQRETIYKERRMVLDGEDVHDYVTKMLHDTVTRYVASAVADGTDVTETDLKVLEAQLSPIYVAPDYFANTGSYLIGMTQEQAIDAVLAEVDKKYAAREAEFGSQIMRELERIVLLRSVDRMWMDHIDAMDEFRKGIGLRAYGQVDPIVAYKKEGFDMFEAMVQAICEDTAKNLMTFRIRSREPERQAVAKPVAAMAGDGTLKKKPTVNKGAKVGRNDPCPCGSGKKYKKCCGFNENGAQ